MSAFVVSQNHIRYLVQTAMDVDCYPTDELRDPTKLGQWLWDANVKSVDYRYDSRHHEDVTYHHGLSSDFVDLYQSLKAIDCFNYQSCECPDYDKSDVKLYLDRLTFALTRDRDWRYKPGYETSKWSL